MAISSRNALTDDPQARFFLAPESPLQRQYEALRAYYVEQLPSHQVARRFRYTPGAFRTVPANAQEEPLEKHYVSSRGRRQKEVLVFLARDASERVLCHA